LTSVNSAVVKTCDVGVAYFLPATHSACNSDSNCLTLHIRM